MLGIASNGTKGTLYLLVESWYDENQPKHFDRKKNKHEFAYASQLSTNH